MHKLYASRYELDIHSKEYKRIKKKNLFFLRVLERNILIKKRNSVKCETNENYSITPVCPPFNLWVPIVF